MVQNRLLPALSVIDQAEPAPVPIHEDRLQGAEQIRRWLGLRSSKQVYKMVERNKQQPGTAPPILRDGTGLVARKSVLAAWYRSRELSTQMLPRNR